MANSIGALIVLAALGLSVFGIVDAARRPQAAWDQVGQSKTMWVVLLAVSILLDFFLFGLIISILYLVIARSKLTKLGFGGTGWGSTPYSGTGGPGDPGGPPPGAWGQAPGAYPGTSWPPATPGSSPPSTPGFPPATPDPSTPDPAPATGSPVAGWYADPGGSGQRRYWDGRAWTTELRP